MSFLDTFSAALPHEIRLEDLKILVPSQWWHDKPEQAAVSALCRCGKFDTQDYLERYPDVAQKGLDPVLHFVQHGIAEKRHFKCLPDTNWGQSKVRLAYEYFQKGEHEKALQVYEELSEQMGEKNFVANIAICKKKLGSKNSLKSLAKEISQPKPKVSVLIPVYNNAQYLHKCIDSVINQTLKEIEIIIINDGSRDPEAVRILNDYAAKDNRIKLIHKQNTGYGHSMNVGLDNATGEYIGIVESDDYISKIMYEKLYDVAVKNICDVVKCDFQKFREAITQNEIVKNYTITGKKYYNKILNLYEDIKPAMFIPELGIWAAIYKNNFIKNCNVRFNETPGASYQDTGFWFQTMCNVKKCYFLNKNFYFYRDDNPHSSVKNKTNTFKICDEMHYIEKLFNKNINKKFYNVFLYKKFSAYLWKYNIADNDNKVIMQQIIQNEFMQHLMSNKANLAYFTEYHIKKLKSFISDVSYKVSVVVPYYNASEYIESCIKDIRNQTLIEIEIILVNDGSTDDSTKIATKFACMDKRITILNMPTNQGAGVARNKGLAAAKGEYIAFLDVDDKYEKNMLELSYNRCKNMDLDIIVWRSDQFDNETNTIRESKFTIKENLIPVKKPFSYNDVEKDIFKIFIGWPWDKLFKRDFIIKNKINFQNIKSSNDLSFVFTSVVCAKKIDILNDILCHHRINIKNSIEFTRYKNYENCILALLELKNNLMDRRIFSKFEKDFINYALHFLLWNIKTLPQFESIKLFNMLNRKFFKELSISGKNKNYFYDATEYNIYTSLIS